MDVKILHRLCFTAASLFFCASCSSVKEPRLVYVLPDVTNADSESQVRIVEKGSWMPVDQARRSGRSYIVVPNALSSDADASDADPTINHEGGRQ